MNLRNLKVFGRDGKEDTESGRFLNKGKKKC